MPMLRPCWLLVVLAAAPAFAAAPPVVRRDLYGDPLPAGAVARVGSLRWRTSLGMVNPVVSPDGRWVVSETIYGGGLHVWEMATGRLVRTLKLLAADDRITYGPFVFMPVGNGLLSSDQGGSGRLYLWDFPEGKLRWTCSVPDGCVTALAVDRSGRLAAAGSINGKIHLYDLKTRKCVHSFPGNGAVRWLAFTANGCLSVVHDDSTDRHFRIRQVDLLTRRVLCSFGVGPVDDSEKRVHLTPDGRHVAAIFKNEVCLWEVRSGVRRRIHSLVHEGARELPDERITTLAFSPDGRTLAALGEQYAWLCDVGSASLVNRILPPRVPSSTAYLVFSRDGKMLGVSEVYEMSWREIRSGRSLRHHPTLPYCLKGLRYSPDGRSIRIASLLEDSLWDAETGRRHCRKMRDPSRLTTGGSWIERALTFLPPDGAQFLDIIGQRIGASVFSQDGHLLFTARGDALRIWNMDRGRLVFTERSKPLEPTAILEPPELCTRLVMSPDGRYLARTDMWGSLCLHEAASGQLLHRITSTEQPLAFAPRGWRFAAAHSEVLSSEPDCILIYDLGALFSSLPRPRQGVQTAAGLWNDLADPDAGMAHRALWRLAILPGMEDFLDRQFRLPPRLDEWLKQQIADLGSDDFATREKAQENLANRGAIVQPALEAALAKTEDLELRKRLERLLEPLDLDGTGALRLHRAVLVLEARGTPAARKVLARLAAGVSGARLTQEAKAALKRLDASGK
jgi:WD40 repeat protein